MPTNKLQIGRLPVFKGQYVAGAYYKPLHRVTHLGSEFQAKREGYLPEPIVLIENGQDYRISDDWQIVSNGTDALVIANTVPRWIKMTETYYQDLLADSDRWATFCERHQDWMVIRMDDGWEPPMPTPTEGSTITAEGILTLNGTITADGVITVGTITSDGVLTL